MTYPKVSHLPDTTSVPSSPRFPAIEEAVLRYWEGDDTFRASVEQRDAGENGENEFVFYDGPPFANGLPHYGHLLTGYVKDVVPRFQTMRGKKVDRRFGWDTHGLPAELEAMDQLGIKTKDEIVALGMEKFNAKCRESVMKYTHEWENYVTRQARWVDFDNDYKTLNVEYMESSGRSSSSGTKASSTRASACFRTAGRTRRRCRTMSCAWTTTCTRCVRIRPSRSASGRDRRRAARREAADLDDDAVDAAGQPGDHGRDRHRLRRGRARRRPTRARQGPPGGVRP